MKPKSGTTLYCFSPPVMLATFAIEIALAVFTWLRYRPGRIRNLVLALLVLLAVFQLAEYYVCGGIGASAMTWSRIGYVAITLLPPLALTLVTSLSKRRHVLSMAVSWGLSLGLVVFFVAAPAAVNVTLCAGNYVIFHLKGLSGWTYGTYYYGVIMLALMASAGAIEESSKPEIQRAVRWIVGGILAFLVPTATVNAISPKTVEAIPSIMCGFAVLFALVVAFRVLPLTAEVREAGE